MRDMPDKEGSHLMMPCVSRRQVLTVAGVALGVGVVDLAGPGSPASAAPSSEVTLEPVADQPVAVLSGDGAAPAVCPRQLAVKVLRGVELPAGAQLSVTFDPRLYAPLSAPVITRNGRVVTAASAVVTSATTGLHTSTVTLEQAVPSTGELLLVVGTANPLLYPYDLVRQPSVPTAQLGRTAKSAPAERRLQPGRPSAFGGPATPWGIELDGAWSRHSWGDRAQFGYYHPIRVTLRSVGPGKARATSAFAVSVDPQLITSVRITAVELNRKPYRGGADLTATRRTGSLYQTRWRVPVRLAPGDVLDVTLTATRLNPPGALPTIKHPVVSLISADDAVAQRSTGKSTLTRADSVWQ
ncbi:hypothetical protein AB0C29_02335 [Actinoplanes sp. NPDC048791]|uniref:hypothetical protein n=1 Tax=Actinoplanes sp. NPDC048791 TaxID=3154623 RepID=UPI0033FCA51F